MVISEIEIFAGVIILQTTINIRYFFWNILLSFRNIVVDNTNIVLGKEFLTFFSNFFTVFYVFKILVMSLVPACTTKLQSGLWRVNLSVSLSTVSPVPPGMCFTLMSQFLHKSFLCIPLRKESPITITFGFSNEPSPPCVQLNCWKEYSFYCSCNYFFINFWLFVTANTVSRFSLTTLN